MVHHDGVISGWALVVWALAVGGAWLLVAAGVQHVRRPRHLQAALLAQRAPASWRRIARWWGPVEVLIGAAVLLVLLLGLTTRWGALAPLAAGLVYLGFAVHLVRVLRRTPGAPCGCLGDEPAGPAGVVRAALFGVSALLATTAEMPDGLTRWAVLAVGVLIALMAAVIPSVLTLQTG